MTPGQKFREAVRRERPLQVAGVIHALAAILAEEAGFRALYISGAGVANASFGKPDLGLTTLEDVAGEVQRISSATDLPVLVDIDTGWGRSLFSGQTMKMLHKAGAAAVHLEDQVEMKRCGHRPGKRLVPVEASPFQAKTRLPYSPQSSTINFSQFFRNQMKPMGFSRYFPTRITQETALFSKFTPCPVILDSWKTRITCLLFSSAKTPLPIA